MDNKYNIKFYNSAKKFMNVSMKLVFNPKVIGVENIPNKPYILAGNHKSLFDIPLLISSIPSEIHFMAKKELFDLIILKDIFAKMGAFPVDRENVDVKAIRQSLKIIRENEVLGLFPEGTRNRSDKVLLPLKDGVTTLANRTKSLIVPFGISGNYSRNKIILNIGNPIDITKIEKASQKEYLENKIKSLILKPDN